MPIDPNIMANLPPSMYQGRPAQQVRDELGATLHTIPAQDPLDVYRQQLLMSQIGAAGYHGDPMGDGGGQSGATMGGAPPARSGPTPVPSTGFGRLRRR